MRPAPHSGRLPVGNRVIIAPIVLSGSRYRMKWVHSRVAIALEKPCHVWRRADGHIETTPAGRVEEIPAQFRTGETWNIYWIEVPYGTGEPTVAR